MTLKIKNMFVHLNRYLINWFETIFRQIDSLKNIILYNTFL